MKNFVLLFIVILLTGMAGCKKNELEGNKVLPTVDIGSQYDCVIDLVNMQQDSIYVINIKKEFEKFFTCENNPQIDFSKKTVLIASGGTKNGISNISTELSFENSIYSLFVDITLNDAAVAQGWHIAVITNKINTSSVMLNVNTHF